MPYYGFNFQWMVSKGDASSLPKSADEKALDFLAASGFNFARIPTDYRFWIRDFDYFHQDETIFKYIDGYLEACKSRNIHLSLNLHRAPGYCINRNDLEKHNLWLDPIAQDAFVFQWETFAHRYKGTPGDILSFDLLNEPPQIGQYALTRHNHADLIRRTVAAIRAIDPDRAIVIDGLDGGNLAMPELSDLGLTHSGRGYQPMPVSHFEADWWDGSRGLPAPVYPGTLWDGRVWNRQILWDSYQSWRDVEANGTKIHIGEFGCYNHTPNEVSLRWFNDLFGIFKEFGWGYALWQFEGPFGIIGNNRPGVKTEVFNGYEIDRALFNLMIGNMA